MEKLISMTDFVLKVQEEYSFEESTLKLIYNYGKFLKQPLTIGMFVTAKLVNGEWVVLEEPKWVSPEGVKWEDYLKEYQEAKERVLFEGFECIKWDHGGDSYSVRKNNGTENEIQVCYYKAIPDYFVWSFDTVEQLCAKDLELTPTAQKQIS